jgi:hypothetical protein
MMINTVVFDLDGTLTDRKTGNIPNSTIDAIQQLKQQKLVVILATGRPYYEIDPVLINQIDADYVVSLNGRVLYDRKGKLLSHQPIDSKVVQDVIEYARNNGLEHGVHTLENTIILAGDSIQEQIENVIKRPRDLSRSKKINESTQVYNVMLKIEDDQQLKTFKTEFPDLIVETFGSIFYDVYTKDADKRIGVEKVFKQTNGQWSKTIVFGDGANDICMANQASIAYAMGDSHPELLKVKDIRVTNKSDEEGVPIALRKVGLIEYSDHRHGWVRFKHRFTTTKLGAVLPIAFFLLLAFGYDQYLMDLPGQSLSFLGLGSISLLYSIYLYLDTK